MNNDSYNRVQIYLPDELKEKFFKLCAEQDKGKSEVGKFIFAEYFRMVDEQDSAPDPVSNQFELLQNQIDNLKHSFANLEAKVNSSLSNNSVITQSELVNNQDSVPNPQSLSSLGQDVSLSMQESKVTKKIKTEPLFLGTENEDGICTEGMEDASKSYLPRSLDDSSGINKFVGKSTGQSSSNSFPEKSRRLLTQHIVPGKVQTFNHSGGAMITEGRTITKTEIDKYFSKLLANCYILAFTDMDNNVFYISGLSDSKPVENYRYAGLYEEGGSVIRGLKRARKKFSGKFEKISALEFLESLPLLDRVKILHFWNIYFEFVPEWNHIKKEVTEL